MVQQSKYVYHYFYTSDLDFAADELDLEYDTRDKIEDVDNFKRQLQNANLWNNELEEFIDNYLRFNND